MSQVTKICKTRWFINLSENFILSGKPIVTVISIKQLLIIPVHNFLMFWLKYRIFNHLIFCSLPLVIVCILTRNGKT